MNVVFQDKNGAPVRHKAFEFFIWSIIVTTGLYIAYIIMLLMYYYTGYCMYNIVGDCYCNPTCVPPIVERSFLIQFRHVILAVMVVGVLVSLHARNREAKHPDPANNKEDPDEKSTRPKGRPRWRLFSIILAVVTPITVTLYVLSWYLPIFNFGESSTVIEGNLALYELINFLFNMNMLCLYMFLIVSLTSLIDSYKTMLEKVFIFKRRVHKSLFALIWIPIAACMVRFGDIFDLVMGTCLLLLCAFMIGMDYKDVQNWKFIDDWKAARL